LSFLASFAALRDTRFSPLNYLIRSRLFDEGMHDEADHPAAVDVRGQQRGNHVLS
jgi:hypothetical protein